MIRRKSILLSIAVLHIAFLSATAWSDPAPQTPEQMMQRLKKTQEPADIQAALNTDVSGYKFEKTTIRDAFDFVRAFAKNVIVDQAHYRRWEGEGVVITLPNKTRTLKQLLEEMLNQLSPQKDSPLAYYAGREFLYISTKDEIERLDSHFKAQQNIKFPEPIQTKLDQRALQLKIHDGCGSEPLPPIHFDGTRLESALSDLSTRSNLDIQIDSNALEKLSVSRDEPVTFGLSNCTFETTLTVLLQWEAQE